MDESRKEMVKDLHTGKVYWVLKIEHGVVVLEDVEGAGLKFTNAASLQGLFAKVEKE
jgi:hypothetical protein